jgi:adenine deaminase
MARRVNVEQRDRARLNELKSQISAAYGREPLDLLVQDVRLVDVYSGRVVSANIGIKAGRVVTISPDSPPVRPAAIFEGNGMYAIPGLIDAHCHIESTLLTPAALSEVIVPQGTTTLLIDPMEIANVAGHGRPVESLASRRRNTSLITQQL